MAKFLPGPVVGQVSGSIGGLTFSHNRFGAFMRSRVKPVVVNTYYTNLQRTFFQQCTSAWKDLVPSNRQAWTTWAQNNPFTDRMGNSQILTGHQAFMSCSITAQRINGTFPVNPPCVPRPAPLTMISLNLSIGAGVTYNFQPTPMTGTQALQVDASLVNSPGITVVKSMFKRILYGGYTVSSPQNMASQLADRFGTLAPGQNLTISVAVADGVTGLLSTPLLKSGILTA